MKVALLGSGKTGHFFSTLAPFELTIFNSKNPITEEKLQGHDLIVSFLPGDIFKEYLGVLVKTKIPVISGSTGFTYSEDFKSDLKNKNLIWIQANNFSLGMNIIKTVLETLSSLNLPESFKTSIHEVHHIEKKDAPSGTALRWKDWLHSNAEITSERIGDVVGFHEVKLETEEEVITISHDAKSRALFAKGAIWACENFKTFNLKPGLHYFDQIVEATLKRGLHA